MPPDRGQGALQLHLKQRNSCLRRWIEPIQAGWINANGENLAEPGRRRRKYIACAQRRRIEADRVVFLPAPGRGSPQDGAAPVVAGLSKMFYGRLWTWVFFFGRTSLHVVVVSSTTLGLAQAGDFVPSRRSVVPFLCATGGPSVFIIVDKAQGSTSWLLRGQLTRSCRQKET